MIKAIIDKITIINMNPSVPKKEGSYSIIIKGKIGNTPMKKTNAHHGSLLLNSTADWVAR